MSPENLRVSTDTAALQTTSTVAGEAAGNRVINVDAAFRRMGGDRELMRDMAGFFVKDGPRLVEKVREALRNGNADDAARAAHSLKGLALNFDAFAAQTVAACIEQCALGRELEEAGSQVDELRREVERVSAALRAAGLAGS